MCEMTGASIDEERLPLSVSDFPENIQQYIVIYSMLPDLWEGMSGVYMGKDLTIFPFLVDTYKVGDVKLALEIIQVCTRINQKLYNTKNSGKRSANSGKEEQKGSVKVAKTKNGGISVHG